MNDEPKLESFRGPLSLGCQFGGAIIEFICRMVSVGSYLVTQNFFPRKEFLRLAKIGESGKLGFP